VPPRVLGLAPFPVADGSLYIGALEREKLPFSSFARFSFRSCREVNNLSSRVFVAAESLGRHLGAQVSPRKVFLKTKHNLIVSVTCII
jgi:hypothetical protein